MAKVKINELVLRDAHQSLIATRMTLDEMLPILSTMDQVGYNAVEMWGGATFDTCLSFVLLVCLIPAFTYEYVCVYICLIDFAVHLQLT